MQSNILSPLLYIPNFEHVLPPFNLQYPNVSTTCVCVLSQENVVRKVVIVLCFIQCLACLEMSFKSLSLICFEIFPVIFKVFLCVLKQWDFFLKLHSASTCA